MIGPLHENVAASPGFHNANKKSEPMRVRLCDGTPVRPLALVWVVLMGLSAAPASAQPARLTPIKTVEVVDPSERISGNAAAGIVLVREGNTIGADRLWAYLSEPAGNLKLRITSVDGRYFAEIDYANAGAQKGWVALDLSLSKFDFLEQTYDDPMSEIAALLSDADTDKPRFYPLMWGNPHRAANVPLPEAPTNTDQLRVYMNTERAQAFVEVARKPAYCRDASAVSGFKFNAICEMTLGDLLPGSVAASGENVVQPIQVYRRAGVRQLEPLALDVQIRY
jgi:hypothetical protein